MDVDEFNSLNGPLESGLHPFTQIVHDYLNVNRTLDSSVIDSPLVYLLGSEQKLDYYQVNAARLIEESKLPSANLLLSLKYKLDSTRNNSEVFNCRELFQINPETYVFVEYGYTQSHEILIDAQFEKVNSVEGLILSRSLDLILDEFMIWLVEVDPIGFEILRRMNRDGFVDRLTITEEIWPRHDSDNYLDKWFNEITDYADSIELTSLITSAQDKDSFMFNIGLQNAVRNADSFTKTDFYRSSNRWDWVSPQLRESDFDD